jgi:hypothetical protein
MIAVALAGCKAVEPAPEDLDGLFHWFWANFDAASDLEILQGVANAHAAMDVESVVVLEGVDGSLSAFTREEMDVVAAREDADPEELAGLYLVNAFACDIERLEEIVISVDQMNLYDGAYDSYERRYLSDIDAYEARDETVLTFESDIEATLLGNTYTQSVDGTARWVAADGDAAFGPVIMARYVLPEPAVFENDDSFFTQDYQVELYYERAPGEVAHLYGIWRNMGFGNASTQDESIARLVLNGLADWDERTAELCAQ